MPTTFCLIFTAVISTALLLAVAESDAAFPRDGEWTSYRRSGTLDAHSPLKGGITEPKVAWKQYVGHIETFVAVEPGEAERTLRVPLDKLGPRSEEVNDPRWGHVPPMAEIEGRVQQISRTSSTIYANILPELPGLEKIEFESGFNKPTVNGHWQPCVGRCFAWRDGKWDKIWETESIDMLFSAMPVAGDFDADGRPEIAILPWHELMIIDALTGKIKDRCRFTPGRSYGSFQVSDIDGDGKSEFIVLSDFAKHIDVLGYRDGKLGILWQKEIELDIQNPKKVLRVNPRSVADVDGDGKQEVVVSFYDETADNRWHLFVYDGLTGAVKLDLVDTYLSGVVDVDGDGAPEMLTTRTTGNGIPARGHIAVQRLRGGKVETLWQDKQAGWQTWDRSPQPDSNHWATLGAREALNCTVEGKTYLVVRKPADDEELMRLCLMSWTDGKLGEEACVVGRRLDAISLDVEGNMLVRCVTRPGESAEVSATCGSAHVLSSSRDTLRPATVAVAAGARDKRPFVVAESSDAEIAVFHAPREGKAAADCRYIEGRGQDLGTGGPGTVIADLQGDGRRQLVYAVTSPAGCGRLVVSDLAGKEIWHHDFTDIPGGQVVWNVGAIIAWQVGHFTDKKQQDVLVTIRHSMMHSEETRLLSGKDGREIWRRERQSGNESVGGAPFAIADYDGDGLDEIGSLYPAHFCLLDGATGKDIAAKVAHWEGVPAQPMFWGQAIAVDFEGAGNVSMLYATKRSSMTGLVRPDGSLVWWDALDVSPKSLPAIGRFDADGKLQAIGIGFSDTEIRCYDTASGKVKWRMPVPENGLVSDTASADINSDGRDEALFTMGRTLYCVGSSEDGSTGSVLWKIELPSDLGAPSIADVHGNGRASILVSAADGYVYCIE